MIVSQTPLTLKNLFKVPSEILSEYFNYSTAHTIMVL